MISQQAGVIGTEIIVGLWFLVVLFVVMAVFSKIRETIKDQENSQKLSKVGLIFLLALLIIVIAWSIGTYLLPLFFAWPPAG